MAPTDPDEVEVRRLVDDWFHKLDAHAPFEELLPLVASEGLEMYWPEGPTFGLDGFRAWYDRVIATFFDEIHTPNVIATTPQGGQSEVKLVVNWQARIWTPPDATSRWLGMDARQTWTVGRSEGGDAVIRKYVVDGLDPMEGSAAL